MTLFHLAPNIVNFKNLALFICHLFIDGNFRSVSVLEDGNSMPFQVSKLLSEIESVCPRSIPMRLIDVADDHSPLPSLPWTPSERIDDRILQLIFLDPNNLPKNIDQLKKLFVFYRIFIFRSEENLIVETSRGNDKLTVQNEDPALNAEPNIFDNSPILSVSESGSVIVKWIPSESDQNVQVIYKQSAENDLKEDHIFDVIFGKHEENWMTTIDHVISIPCVKDSSVRQSFWVKEGHTFYGNLFMNRLNASYINLSVQTCHNSVKTWKNQSVIGKPRRFYKELTTEFEPVSNRIMKKLKKSRPNIVHFDLPSVSSGAIRSPLYPYRSTKLIVIFVYGDDFHRKTFHEEIGPNHTAAHLFLLTIILVAIVVCYLRRTHRLQRDGYISSFIDVGVVFIGGGNLRINHYLERLIFGFLFIGGFFLVAMWYDAILYPSILIHNRKIQTLDELSKIKPPVYNGFRLKENTAVVMDMLKDKFHCKIRYKGTDNFYNLLRNHKNSFAFVTKEHAVDASTSLADDFRDFDILTESLGTLNYPYYLASEQYVPKKLANKIGRVTGAIMENGIYRFYKSYSRYLEELDGLARRNITQQSFVVSAYQLTKGLLIALSLISLVFVAEVVVHWFKVRRHRRIRPARTGP